MTSLTGAIKAVIFDFGGVLAEEGFKEGLWAIGRKNGLDPEEFRKTADELIHETGYVTGRSDETRYWETLRRKTGIAGSDRELRNEIVKRFVLRPEMIGLAQKLKERGLITAILSDQTNWLDEIDRDTPFFHHFLVVFNSYTIKKSKRDPSVFRDICAALGVAPHEALFIDDNADNIRRAANEGMKVIQFHTIERLMHEIAEFVRL
jgi:putative hydrolase of the HAD superfamily